MKLNCAVLSVPPYTHRYIAPMLNSGDIEKTVSIDVLTEEVCRQEAELSHLHKLLASSPHNTIVQERLWEAQRILTLLKVRASKPSTECVVGLDLIEYYSVK